ncbi:hypothetical protein VPG91_11355 [Nitrospirillum amazonense]|uniref:hypothetical protein n=1 Tax=Nitrospirillum amazonense TaxID=28077 RepID=UPI002DD4488F|nr:hypothetical protein [Nitrospirillum amazonense]MEC4591585.1 hypothetical protein [Nitrospirillum amazonense]
MSEPPRLSDDDARAALMEKLRAALDAGDLELVRRLRTVFGIGVPMPVDDGGGARD